MGHVQGVPAAGVVHVEAAVLGDQAVVAGVVDPAKAQGGPQVAPLGRVVVDDIENDLEARGMERLHHAFELADLLPLGSPAGVPRVRGEEPDGVVAPVIREAPVHQVLVGDKLVDRHELHRRDAQGPQVLDHRGAGQARVGPPPLRWDIRVPHGEALDVGLIDDRVVPGDPRRPILAPVERRIDDHALRNSGGAVAVVLAEVRVCMADFIAEQHVAPADGAIDRLGVGVQQELGGIEAVPVGRVVGAVDAVPVALAWPRLG